MCNPWERRVGPPQPRYYFLAQTRRKKVHVIPVANTVGCVQRANREFKLQLTKTNIVEYLNFYYSFTPKNHPILSQLGEKEATQFALPRTLDDLRLDPANRTGPPEPTACSEECLMQGAVWQFLDEQTHKQIVPIRFRRRNALLVRFRPIAHPIQKRGVRSRCQSAGGERHTRARQSRVPLPE